jgi:hypothetical protein
MPMDREGPTLEALMRRLAEAPEDFLADPKVPGAGRVHVAAVVGDLVRMLGGDVIATELREFSGGAGAADRNRLAVVLMLCWLLADEWFQQARPSAADVFRVLGEGAAELAAGVSAPKFQSDPDRREEIARFALALLGYRPAGETPAQAQDRLTSLSSAERARVLKAARAAEERARAIREALVRKAAEESADKWTRE